MRRKDREQTDPAFFDKVLHDAETIWLSMKNGNDAPYVIPLNFVYHKGFLYIHCANEGLKLDLIRKDPCVGFAIATDIQVIREKSTTKYRSVCGSGKASILEDPEEKQAALMAIREHYTAQCTLPLSAERLAKIAVIQIAIEQMTGKAAGKKE